MTQLLMNGWVWALAYVSAVAIAVAYCAALEALYPEKEFDPAECPWEGGEAEDNHPRQKEIAR